MDVFAKSGRLLAQVFILCFSLNSWASFDIFIFPAAVNAGNYTLSWDNTGVIQGELYESYNGAPEVTLSTHPVSPYSFSNKPPGVYQYRLFLCKASSGVGGCATSSVTITVEEPAFFSIDDVTGSEGDDFTFTITRTGGTRVSHSVDLYVAGSSDHGGADSTVTLSAGETSKTFSIATFDDNYFEPTETFFVDLSNPSQGASITKSRGIGSILNNDGVPVISLVGDDSVSEGGQLQFTVARSVSAEPAQIISYQVTGGSATAGSDYVQQSGSVTFNSTFQNTKTFTIDTLEDELIEGDEELQVTLTGATGGAVISSSANQATGRIIDNDTAVWPTAYLTAPTSGVSYNVGQNLSLTAGVTVGTDPIQSVSFYRNGSLIGTDSSAPYQINWTVPSAGQHSLTVTAIDTAGRISSSSPVVIVNGIALQPPAAPTLQVDTGTNNTTGIYTVSWNNTGATSYRLDECTLSVCGSNDWHTVINSSNRAQDFTGKGNGTYAYRVNACNAVGCNLSSVLTVTVTLPVPQRPGELRLKTSASCADGVTSGQSTGGFEICWEPVSGDPDHYKLQEKIADGSWQYLASIDGNQTDYTFSGKTTNTYFYQVQACNVSGACSDFGGQLEVAVIATPQLFSAIIGCNGSCVKISGLGFDSNTQVEASAVDAAAVLKAYANPELVLGSNSLQFNLDDASVNTALNDTGLDLRVINTVNNNSETIRVYSGNQDPYLNISNTMPTVSSDGIIYVAATNKLYAYDVFGNPINNWPFSAVGAINTQPALSPAEDTVYVGSTDNNLYAVNAVGQAQTAQQRWQVVTGGPVASPLVDQYGFINVGSLDKNFYSVDPSGEVRWSYTATAGIAEKAVIYGDYSLSFRSLDSQLHNIRAGVIGPQILSWQSRDDSLLKDYLATVPESFNDFVADGWNVTEMFQVGRLFEGLLQRHPDKATLTFWTYALLPEYGATLEEVANAFLYSDDGNALYGMLNNTTFVQALYQNILGISDYAAQSDYQGYVDSLNNGAATRAQVVLAFTNGVEFSSQADQELLRIFQIFYGFCLESSCEYLADSDDDGLGDQWELDNFGDLTSQTGSGDADADGLSNYEEYVAGTNPLNLPIISGESESDNGSYTLVLSAANDVASSRSYELYEKRDSDADWPTTPIGTYSEAADGELPFTIAITGKMAGTYQYRARACLAGLCSDYSTVFDVEVSALVGTIDTPPAPFNAIGNLQNLISPADKNATDQVGSVPGSFRVDESGAATYSIPIATATGTAGVTPQISLNYSNQGGNGLVGLGWSISGLSAITRCRQTLHQDRKPLPITWSADDRFCLDGQRLIVTSGDYGAPGSIYKTEIDSFAKITAIGGSAGHPGYFQVERKDGSVSFYGNTVDSKQQNNASQTLTWAINKFQDSVGNPIWFIYENDGSSSDSQRIKEVRYAYGSAMGPDSHNAAIVFNYTSAGRMDPINGYVSGYLFETNQRLETIVTYNEGQELRNYQLTYLDEQGNQPTSDQLSRLAAIEECVGSECLPATVFEWSLPQQGFMASSGEVNLSPKSDRTVFAFKPADINGDGNMDLAWLELDVDGVDEQDHQLRYALSNGTLLVNAEFASGAHEATYHEDLDEKVKMEVLDYNADGRMDVAVYSPRAGNWRIHLSQPQLDGTWKLSSYGMATPLESREVQFADINSDGLVDAYSLEFGDLKVSYLEPSGAPIESDNYYHFSTPQTLASFSWDLKPVIISLGGDYNGDGKVDLIIRTLNFDTDNCIVTGAFGVCEITRYHTIYTLAADGTLETLSTAVVENYVDSSGIDLLRERFFLSADINGDGLRDILYRYREGELGEGTDFTNTSSWRYKLSHGNGFGEAVVLPEINVEEPFTFDYNSDGYPDILWHDGDAQALKAQLWNAKANSFDPVTTVRNAGSNENIENHLFFDINGDSVDDYVYFQSSSSRLSMYKGNGSGEPENAITLITNGLGAETAISYETLAQTEHYQRVDVKTQEQCQIYTGRGYFEYCTTSADDFYRSLNGAWDLPDESQTLAKYSPVLELNGPINVVTRVESSAPVAGNNTAKSAIEYHYGEAKVQASGRGLLGFHSLTTVDKQTGVETTTLYRQDWPFIGYPLRTEVRSSAGHLLSESDNTWKIKNYQDTWGGIDGIAATQGTAHLGAVQPYIEQSVERTYALVNDGANKGDPLQTVTTDNVYDTYGNPTSITVTTEGGGKAFQKITTNSYSGNDLILRDHISSQSPAELGRLSRTVVESKRDEQNDGSYEISDTRASSFTYYSSGRKAGLLQTETIEAQDSANTLTTTHDYDYWGNRVRSAVQGNGTTRCDVNTAAYDGTGRYVDITYDCLGRKTSEVVGERNAYGEPLQVNAIIDINGSSSVITRYGYTDRGIRYIEANEAGTWKATTLHQGTDGLCPNQTAYHSKGQMAGGGETRECFDVLGRTIRTLRRGFNGDWIYQDTEYDNLGRVKRRSEPYFENAEGTFWTAFDYDILGRVTHTELPDGSDGWVAYDGFTTITTNDLGQVKKETKNAQGEIIRVDDNLGGVATYAYDAHGNMTHMTSLGNGDVAASTTQICYDDLGRKIAMRDPDKGGYVSGSSTACPASTETGQARVGWWLYTYNAFGDLTRQIDAKGQISNLYYDGLGRLINRIDQCSALSQGCSLGAVESNTAWVYDMGVNGLGQLHSVEDSISGYLKEHTYDSLGRQSKTLTSLGNGDGDHYEKVTYDQYSRTFQLFDAARDDDIYNSNGVLYHYNSHGYRDQLKDASTINGEQIVYQTINSIDARGNITGESRGNNVVSGMQYNAASGRLEQLFANNSQFETIQNLHYQWDTLGNLEHRQESSGGKNLQEQFGYDGLNRLTSYNVVNGSQKSLRYNSLGNIVYKSDVCNSSSDCYTYGNNAGPHAVTSVNGSAYHYDANGNNISGDGRTLHYTTFDKVKQISKGSHTTTFAYGPDRSRYKRTDTNTSGTRTTLYLGSVEKITQPDGSKQIKRYIGGIAILTEYADSNNTPTQADSLHYIYKDHLGSIDVITDSIGNIIQGAEGEQSFDAWGQRRNATTWQDISDAIKIAGFGVLANPSLTTSRGFTGHEMVDEVGIIHMNGRIYDPKLGRFLQADPFVQEATNTQSLNRYSYTINNPLNATDPSGYIFKEITQAFQIVFAVMVTVACAGTCAPLTFAAVMGVGTYIMTGGNVRAAFTSAAMAFAGADLFPAGGFGSAGTTQYVATVAVLGGMASALNGGKFGHGFVSAGLGTIAGGAIKLGNNIHLAVRAGIKAVIGGTLSSITGGKFANGAATAAFASLMGSAAQASTPEKGGPPDASPNDDEQFRKINPDPDGDGVDNITFDNDEAGKPSTDVPVRGKLATLIEDSVQSSGVDININSSVRGPCSNSAHCFGNAVDINRVDGLRVDNPLAIDKVTELQNALQNHPNIRENLGPLINTRTISSDNIIDLSNNPTIVNKHKNHIHTSAAF